MGSALTGRVPKVVIRSTNLCPVGFEPAAFRSECSARLRAAAGTGYHEKERLKRTRRRFHKPVALNPMSWVVRGYRYRLLSGPRPSWRELAVIAAYSLAVFVLGGVFFRHLKRGFADVL
jgi:hypothetical protein